MYSICCKPAFELWSIWGNCTLCDFGVAVEIITCVYKIICIWIMHYMKVIRRMHWIMNYEKVIVRMQMNIMLDIFTALMLWVIDDYLMMMLDYGLSWFHLNYAIESRIELWKLNLFDVIIESYMITCRQLNYDISCWWLNVQLNCVRSLLFVWFLICNWVKINVWILHLICFYVMVFFLELLMLHLGFAGEKPWYFIRGTKQRELWTLFEPRLRLIEDKTSLFHNFYS
jgi:hypothetical protein